MPGFGWCSAMRRNPHAVRTLGHVVLNVRSHAHSVPLYEQIFGLRVVGPRNTTVRAHGPHGVTHGVNVFWCESPRHRSSRDRRHHRACSERPGLAHLASRVGKSLGDLTAFIARLRALGVKAVRTVHHESICSAYFSDPDGLVLETYVGDDRLPLRGRPYQATARPPILV
jgi:catechol-2,3-dioxygenase